MRTRITRRWQLPDTDPDSKHFRGARWDGWEMVWNAVSAERCPRCMALVQTRVRYLHEEEHERADDMQVHVRAALERILDELGIPYRSADEVDDDDGAILPPRDTGFVIGDTGLGAGEAQKL